MRHIGILKPDKWIAIVNWFGVPIFLIYIFSMFVYPWFCDGAKWACVQNTWDRWQGLNVGVLAFASSIIAFSISRYNAQKQKERDFLAAKAFLPNSLSELCDYFSACASLLEEAWRLGGEDRSKLVVPELPESYKEVFGNCIRYSESDVGDYLTNILVNLQINHSRLKAFSDRLSASDKINIITYVYRLGELQALVNRLFPYARNMQKFDAGHLEWEDFRNAYSNFFTFYEDFSVDEKNNLVSLTLRKIEASKY